MCNLSFFKIMSLSGKMVRLDLGDVLLRRMQEKDVDAVKALIKVRFNIISLMSYSLYIIYIYSYNIYIQCSA